MTDRVQHDYMSRGSWWAVSVKVHSRPQRPRSFWSAPRIATSGHVRHRKSVIHGLPVTLRMLRVKSGKSDWFWSQSTVFTKPFKTGMPLDRSRGRDSWCWPKGARPLGTRMVKVISPVLHCASLLRIILRVISSFFFTAGPRRRGKSSFSRKRLRWPIIFFSVVLNWVVNISIKINILFYNILF